MELKSHYRNQTNTIKETLKTWGLDKCSPAKPNEAHRVFQKSRFTNLLSTSLNFAFQCQQSKEVAVLRAAGSWQILYCQHSETNKQAKKKTHLSCSHVPKPWIHNNSARRGRRCLLKSKYFLFRIWMLQIQHSGWRKKAHQVYCTVNGTICVSARSVKVIKSNTPPLKDSHLLRGSWDALKYSRSVKQMSKIEREGKAQTCSAAEGVYRCLWPPDSASACSGWMPGSAGPLSHPPGSGGNSSASSHHWTETMIWRQRTRREQQSEVWSLLAAVNLHVLSRSFSDMHFLFTSSLFLGGNYSCFVINRGLKWDLADLE